MDRDLQLSRSTSSNPDRAPTDEPNCPDVLQESPTNIRVEPNTGPVSVLTEPVEADYSTAIPSTSCRWRVESTRIVLAARPAVGRLPADRRRPIRAGCGGRLPDHGRVRGFACTAASCGRWLRRRRAAWSPGHEVLSLTSEPAVPKRHCPRLRHSYRIMQRRTRRRVTLPFD